MGWLLGFLGFFLLGHCLIAFIASVAIVRDASLDGFQRFGKFLMSWFLLYFGPLMILKLMKEYSPESVPSVAKSGLIAWILYGRLNPDFHNYEPVDNATGAPLVGDRPDTWGDNIEGSCGSDGD